MITDTACHAFNPRSRSPPKLQIPCFLFCPRLDICQSKLYFLSLVRAHIEEDTPIPRWAYDIASTVHEAAGLGRRLAPDTRPCTWKNHRLLDPRSPCGELVSGGRSDLHVPSNFFPELKNRSPFRRPPSPSPRK